jgi:hypothetical protein
MTRNRLVAACALLAAGCSEFDLRNNPDADGGPAPDILVTPPSLEFGLLASGEQEVQTFNVQNVGDATLNVSDVVIGAGIAFKILGPETTFDLEPGESTDVQVQFEPMGADENFGQAVVMSDDPDSPEAGVDLLGLGAVPELQITPGSYVFSDTVVPCGDSVQLELKNVGTEDLVVTDWKYESGGLLVLHDDVARPLLPITLAPGETGFVDVEFVATTAGSYFGQFTVFSNDPRGEVTADQNGEGNYLETKTEAFTEPGVPPVDVMILIDHSGSMEDANTPDIEAGFPDFVTELEQVADWQLLEVTREDGCGNGGIMDPSTPNPAQLLIDHAWDAGGGGVFGPYLTEALLQLADIALDQTDPGECNAGFLRPGALLHIIVISDEPEQSGQTAAHWVAEYENHVTAPEFVKVSGVVSDGGCPALAEVGTGYLNAISQTGGSQVDICNSNWGSTFGAIASEVLAGSRTYNLEDEADPASVIVTVNGTPTTDISVVGDAVTVNSPAVGEGDLVEITYGVLADCE